MSKCVQFILKKSKGPILGTFDVWYKESESIIPPKVVCFSYVTIWKSLGGSLQPKYDKGGLGSQLKAKSLYFKSCIRYILVFNHVLLQIFQILPYWPWMVVGHLGQALTPVLSPVGQGQYSDSAHVLTQHRRMEERHAKDYLSKDTPVIKDCVQVLTVGLFHLSCEIMSFWRTVIKRNFLLDKI